MDYLKLADTSKNPAIAKAAVKLAQERQKQLHKSDARISPVTATVLATLVGIASVGACWYALTHHPGGMGQELVVVIGSVSVLIICLYALFSGHLSQTNFMTAVRAMLDRLKSFSPFNKN
jgi:hypothetical protein